MLWKRQPYEQKEPVRCPVCKSKLGERFFEDLLVAPCKECDWVFIFKPQTEKPECFKKGHLTKRCGCGGCGR